MVGGMCDRGHAWWGVCMAGGMHGGGGAYMAGEKAIATGSMHPIGMHSCLVLLAVNLP